MLFNPTLWIDIGNDHTKAENALSRRKKDNEVIIEFFKTRYQSHDVGKKQHFGAQVKDEGKICFEVHICFIFDCQ